MSKKTRSISIVVFVVAFAAMLAGVFLSPTAAKHESIQETMRDAVLHGSNKVSLFGLKEVNPGLISAFTVTAVIFVFALIVRIFVIPRFKMVPGKFQMVLEEAVGLFEGLAKSNSPHRNGFLGTYIFTAGVYIFIGTLFELFGVQAVTTAGNIISLPAPLSDINGAICLGVLSYCIILSGGIVGNGLRGVGQTLKDFSLPISMSFRLFGALLSGALVTELVYYYFNLSIGLPVFVGVMFTLLHALIQAYVLTMLTSLFYGEVSEKHEKKPKVKKNKQETIISEVSAS
ncbi:MAG: F0F1 ATP synthase subunit A [Eubacterium sp.]|nr:F0F1 ATP synthase subunit A [Eubacterium sp.]